MKIESRSFFFILSRYVFVKYIFVRLNVHSGLPKRISLCDKINFQIMKEKQKLQRKKKFEILTEKSRRDLNVFFLSRIFLCENIPLFHLK